MKHEASAPQNVTEVAYSVMHDRNNTSVFQTLVLLCVSPVIILLTHSYFLMMTAHESKVAEQNDTRVTLLSCVGKFCLSILPHEAMSK